MVEWGVVIYLIFGVVIAAYSSLGVIQFGMNFDAHEAESWLALALTFLIIALFWPVMLAYILYEIEIRH